MLEFYNNGTLVSGLKVEVQKFQFVTISGTTNGAAGTSNGFKGKVLDQKCTAAEIRWK